MRVNSIFTGFLFMVILTASSDAQVFEFGARYPAGGHPRCVVSADFDGDGDIDLAVGHQEDNYIFIYSNEGDAIFSLTDSIPSFHMREIFTADLNGDGYNDLMACEEWGYPTFYYYNSVDTSFYVGFSREIGSWSEDMMAADFNGDDIMDVAFGNIFEGSGLFILFGLGDGVFEDAVTVLVPNIPISHLAVADFDNDGDMDIVYKGGYLFTLLNNGDGTFADPIQVNNEILMDFVVADMNNDQYPDLVGRGVQSCAGYPRYILGNGDGTFTLPENAFQPGNLTANTQTPADFNSDGYTDIIICSDDSFLRCGYNNGFLEFSTEDLPYGYTGATCMTANDFDGDGDIDLAVTNLDSCITIVLSLASAHMNRMLVPDDIPSIGDAIDYCWNLDTIIVQPGTYQELIDFDGKNLVLASQFFNTGDESYISSTILDGGGEGTVLTFDDGEDYRSVIMGFTIRNGNAPGYGGGIFCYDVASPTISNNIIKNNYSTSVGGGIMASTYSESVISNNIIYDNSCGTWGGGIYVSSSNATIINNVIFGNSADDNGGGLHTGFTLPLVMNNIIWNNSSPGANPQVGYFGDVPSVVSFSDIQGGWDGEGNVDIDPLFRDPGNGDFHLMAVDCGNTQNSPCIDIGCPENEDAILNCDFGLGELSCDMGAYGGGNDAMVDIDDDQYSLPSRFSVLQNYPNPFNSSTTISYSLPVQSDVRIDIFNILGQRVFTLFDGNRPAGNHIVTWQADDFPSGFYFAQIRAGKLSNGIKMLLLK